MIERPRFRSVQPRMRLDIEWSDLRYARKITARLASASTRGPSVRTGAMNRILECWGEPALVGASVRSLFDALLSGPLSTAARQCSRVAMSAVSQPDMAWLARTHGYRVVPLDLQPDRWLPSPESVERECKKGVAAVVVAQLFGARSSLAEIGKVCRAYDTPLIEDAAQALSGIYRGDPAADVSLFSFGPIKRHTALGGGIATVRNPEWLEAASGVLRHQPIREERWFYQRVVRFTALKALTAPAIFGTAMGAAASFGVDREAWLKEVARGYSGPNRLRQYRMAPSTAQLLLMARRLGSPVPWQDRAGCYRRLVEFSGVCRPAPKAAHHAAWLCPVLLDDAQTQCRLLAERGFDATTGASNLRALPGAPTATSMMERVVYLPHPVHMDETRRAELARALRAVSGPAPEMARNSVNFAPIRNPYEMVRHIS
ncbi:MAG: DegT/DnrJ/EryC1/StrS family aminotransferase [Myxococcota bacterium]